MSGAQRCDEILRMIDDVLRECELDGVPAPAPASGPGPEAIAAMRRARQRELAACG